MFIVGVVVGRRAEQRARLADSDGQSHQQILEELHRLTNTVDAPLAIATVADDTTAHDASETVRLHSIARAIQGVMMRGLEAERKLAAAQLHLDQQSDVIRQHANAARTDALTGMINRGAFDEVIARRTAEAARTGQPLSLALYDIDHFKQCNDQYGHQMGDAVLATIAGVIHEQTREMDIVARYGGEEFAVVMPATAIEWAVRGVERVRLAVARTTFPDKLRHLNTTVSVGIAEFRVGDTPTSLIARADEALYASKHAGRNRSSIHDGRTTRPVSVGGVVRPQSESWTTVADDLKTELGQMVLRPNDTLSTR